MQGSMRLECDARMRLSAAMDERVWVRSGKSLVAGAYVVADAGVGAGGGVCPAGTGGGHGRLASRMALAIGLLIPVGSCGLPLAPGCMYV